MPTRSTARPRAGRPALMALVAVAALATCAGSHAQTPALPDELRQAESLIEALMKQGMLPRARGEAMLREGRQRAGLEPAGAASARAAKPVAANSEAVSNEALRARLKSEVREEVRTEVRDEVLSSAQALMDRVQPAPEPPPVDKPAAAAATSKVVRVQYVPQVVRDAIRNEIKEEIVAQARAEQWGAPAVGSVPEWTDRIKVEGDIRVRSQRDNYGKDNPSPEDFLLASLGGTTRAADLAAGNAAGLPLANTEDDRSRLRLRARLGFTAKVSDSVSAGLRLATGSASDRVSTNQTLGQNANRYQFLLDRAFIRFDPYPWLGVAAGRMANPWFGTDMQWSESLSFEGVAATARWPGNGARTVEPFVTLGWFPIRENAPPRPGRSLAGAQAGFGWELGRTRLRFGLAQYVYQNLEGQVDADYDATLGAGRSYGQYEYEAGLRQRGNTLFLTNNPAEVAAGLTPDRFKWGLASKFRPLALTAAAELSQFAPVTVMLSGELVRNMAFDRAEIARRTGLTLTDGSNTGFSLRATVGAPDVRQRGQWQASMGYRRVGSDAVLDAFTDSDLGLGGTNISGVSASFLYGLDRNVTLGLRYLSARQLDSMTVQPEVKSKYSIDSLQVDLNARF